ncbi:MAG TPA: MarR family transcriptional regulator [Alphaproteobacteria bacterium]|jgi:DNA-binding MarR family transcriptional regulator
MGFLAKEAARAFVRTLAPRIARYGVSPGQWNVLRILWEQDGLSQRDISRRLGIMDPSTASTLASLARDGLIVRRKHPTDGRQTLVFLSAPGRALRDRVIHCARDVNALAAAGIDAEEIALCRRVLVRMIENLQGGR